MSGFADIFQGYNFNGETPAGNAPGQLTPEQAQQMMQQAAMSNSGLQQAGQLAAANATPQAVAQQAPVAQGSWAGVMGTAPNIPIPPATSQGGQAPQATDQGPQALPDSDGPSMNSGQAQDVANSNPSAIDPAMLAQRKSGWDQFIDHMHQKLQDPDFLKQIAAMGAGMAGAKPGMNAGQVLGAGAGALQAFNQKNQQEAITNQQAQQKLDQSGQIVDAKTKQMQQDLDISKATQPYQIANAYIAAMTNVQKLGSATAQAQIDAIKAKAESLFGVDTAKAMLDEAQAKVAQTQASTSLTNAQTVTEGQRPGLVAAQSSASGAGAAESAAKSTNQNIVNNIIQKLSPDEQKFYVGAEPKTLSGGNQALSKYYEMEFRKQNGIPLAGGTPDQEKQVAGAVTQFMTQAKSKDDMTLAAQLTGTGAFDDPSKALAWIQQQRGAGNAAGAIAPGTVPGGGSTLGAVPSGITKAFSGKPNGTAGYDPSTNTTYYVQGGKIQSKPGKWVK